VAKMSEKQEPVVAKFAMKRAFALERGLLVAIDHSKITGSCTNRSVSKSAWSIPKGQRFNDWQINPIHKRISHTDHYVLSCFTKKN